MIKILHCADLHLDSPLTSLGAQKAEQRRNELRAAFTSLIMSVKMNDVNFLLIAGDLFDSDYVTKDTVALLCREFASIPDCNIIIAPGNHDPYSTSSYYRRIEFPENVYIFDSPAVSCFDFPEHNVAVYGYAFVSDKLEFCPIEGFKPADSSRINILVAHGELDTESSVYCPLPLKALEECGFDYIALGHRHSFTEPIAVAGGYAAYSGCLEGRGFDECGPKGAIMAAAEKNGTLKFVSKFSRYSKRSYETERVDVSGAESNADLLDKIRAVIDEKRYGSDVALRVIMEGEVSDGFVPSSEFLAGQLSELYYAEIKDKTVPILNREQLASDPTLKGEFYRSLEPMLNSDDESERELAADALRCGLAALAGNDFYEI